MNELLIPYNVPVAEDYKYQLGKSVTNTYTPVNHGGVAGVHVDADAVAGLGVSSTTNGMQALQHTKSQSAN